MPDRKVPKLCHARRCGRALGPRRDDPALAAAARAGTALARRKLAQWAAWMPHRIFLAERAGAAPGAGSATTRRCDAARAIGQALLDRGLGPERPVMILSDNGIDHALLALGAMQVGVPVAPVSDRLSLLSRDFAKLRYVAAMVEPGLIFADDGGAMARRSRRWSRARARVAASRQPAAGLRRHRSRRCARRRRRQAPEDALRAPSGRTRWRRSSSPRARPASPRASSTRSACSARTRPAIAAGLAVPRATAAGGRRLAAVEPHLRRQPQFQPRARQWRHALHRRGQAGARAHRAHGRESARGVADALLQRAARLRRAARSPRARCALRARVLPRARRPLLCRARRCRPSCGSGSRRWSPRPAGQRRDASRPGARPRPRRWRPHVIIRIERAGNIGLPLPGTEIKLVPDGEQARDPRARARTSRPAIGAGPSSRRAAFDDDGFYPHGRRRQARRPDARRRAASSSTAASARTSS